jgi:hypothetical protein
MFEEHRCGCLLGLVLLPGIWKNWSAGVDRNIKGVRDSSCSAASAVQPVNSPVRFPFKSFIGGGAAATMLEDGEPS